MTGILHTYIPNRVIDSNGISDGASIAFYLTGTTTPATIYTSAALTTPRANPVVVGAGAAVPDVYLDPAVTYRRVVTFSDGSTQDTDPWTGIASGGVSFLQAGTGAVTRSMQDKGRDAISVKDFGAVGDGTTDDSVAINAAIAAAAALPNRGTVVFPAGTYMAHGLTCGANGVVLCGQGSVNIMKNANGALLSMSGADCSIQGLRFYGDGYTGDNVVFTGDRARVLDCGSQGAAGRALKMTGTNNTVMGTNGAFATTDATGTGYDIEIGKTGGVLGSLYNVIVGVITTQQVGGILEINTGSTFLLGCQFGKLYKQSSTPPTGVNGGHTVNCRILGAVTIEHADSAGMGNLFNATASLTFAVGTSGHAWDESNVFASACTITNNGNAAAPIFRSIGTAGKIKVRYGADASGAYWETDIDAVAPSARFSGVVAGTGIDLWDGAALFSALSRPSGTNVNVGNSGGFVQVVTSTTGFLVNCNGTEQMRVDSSKFTMNTANLGNYANDAAAAAGGVAVGQLYRNGSVIQIRIV